MIKQTKLIKFMVVILLLIPIVLFFTAIVQTFVLKSKQSQLANIKQQLQQSQLEQQKQQSIYDYLDSNQYTEDYYKHNKYNGESYGNDGDVNIEITKE